MKYPRIGHDRKHDSPVDLLLSVDETSLCVFDLFMLFQPIRPC